MVFLNFGVGFVVAEDALGVVVDVVEEGLGVRVDRDPVLLVDAGGVLGFVGAHLTIFIIQITTLLNGE